MIDFANAKSIFTPKGEVSIISRGSEILWRKQKYKCEVEYLESTGTQYIDTLLNPTDEYGYHIKNTYKYGGGEQCAIGCMDNGNRFVGVYTSGVAVSGGWGNFVGSIKSSYSFTEDDIWEISCNYKNDRKIILNGEELKDLTDIHIVGTINSTLTLFARHYGTNITKMIGKIYGVEITKGADIVADFIPVLDWNDRPCMYDKVTDELYYNQGTGEFIAGRQIWPVEWLESTGEQWIDTDYKGNTTRTRYETKIIPAAVGVNQGLFGSRNTVGIADKSNCDMLIYGSSNSFRLDWAQGSSTALVPATVNTPYVIDITRGRAVVNGEVFTFSDATSVEQNNNFLIGNFTNGSAEAFSGGFIGKICYSKLYDNDTLVRDYIAAHDENGVGFLFDRVTHTIFDNAGTGEFLYGGDS